MSENLTGKLFIISGPSGVGKGTVIAALKSHFPQFVFPISCTTRVMRPGEKDGETYHFISEERFAQSVAAGEFLETAVVHGKDSYGTLKRSIVDALKDGKVVIREVDLAGFLQIKKQTSVIPSENLFSIFLEPSNPEKFQQQLTEQINMRGKLSDEEMERRMKSAMNEMAHAGEYNVRVPSYERQVEKLVNDVEKVIRDECEKAGIKI